MGQKRIPPSQLPHGAWTDHGGRGDNKRKQKRSISEPASRLRPRRHTGRQSEDLQFDQLHPQLVLPEKHRTPSFCSGRQSSQRTRPVTSGKPRDRHCGACDQAVPGQLQDPDGEQHVARVHSVPLPRMRAAQTEGSGLSVVALTDPDAETTEESLFEVEGKPWTPMPPRTPSEGSAPPSYQRRLASGGSLGLAAHGSSLALLAISDVLVGVENWRHRQDEGVFRLGLALGLLYAALLVWIAMRHAARAAWAPCSAHPQSALLAGVAWVQKWLLLAALHISLAFVSAWWRQALRRSCHPGARVASVTLILQLLATVLYSTNGTGAVALSCVSFLAVVVLEDLDGASVGTVFDDTLLLASAGIACTVVALSRSSSKDSVQGLCYRLRDIFSSILTEEYVSSQFHPIETRLDQLVSRLEEAKKAAHQSSLDPQLRDVLEQAFGFLLNELTHLSALGGLSVRELQDAPPMTVEYVQRTLNQDGVKPSIMTSEEDLTRRGANPTIDFDLEASRKETGKSMLTFDTLKNLIDLPDERGEDESSADHDQSNTYDESLSEMMHGLRFCRRSEFRPPPVLPEELNRGLRKHLGMWRFDMFKLNRLTGGRPLIVVGTQALADLAQRMDLDTARLQHFLDNIECRYDQRPYHNSMHGTDVMNSMLYFLNLMRSAGEAFDLVESLAALVAAGSHDVGHKGLSNGFQLIAETALSRLYNDQSCLENMHSSITFSVLNTDSSNFLKHLPAPIRATFRAWVIQMILDTDLGKHIQTVSRFKQEFKTHRDPSVPSTSARRRELAGFALKCCDVAHSAKPFGLHVHWTLRINDEFFQQGDIERQLGLPCSPFCDRNVTRVAESQVGFYDFIVSPLFTAIDEYLDFGQLRVEILPEAKANRSFWKNYDGLDFDYSKPMSNVDMLNLRFNEFNMPKGKISVVTAFGAAATKDRSSPMYATDPCMPKVRAEQACLDV